MVVETLVPMVAPENLTGNVCQVIVSDWEVFVRTDENFTVIGYTGDEYEETSYHVEWLNHEDVSIRPEYFLERGLISRSDAAEIIKNKKELRERLMGDERARDFSELNRLQRKLGLELQVDNDTNS